MNEEMTKSQRFNHAVGEVVGTILQFFGGLYLILAFIMGASVLMMGTYNVLTGWYTDYGGATFEGLFWVITPCVGILLLAFDYGRALWRGLQEWVGSKRAKTTDQPDDG